MKRKAISASGRSSITQPIFAVASARQCHAGSEIIEDMPPIMAGHAAFSAIFSTRDGRCCPPEGRSVILRFRPGRADDKEYHERSWVTTTCASRTNTMSCTQRRRPAVPFSLLITTEACLTSRQISTTPVLARHTRQQHGTIPGRASFHQAREGSMVADIWTFTYKVTLTRLHTTARRHRHSSRCGDGTSSAKHHANKTPSHENYRRSVTQLRAAGRLRVSRIYYY